jgi:hypothetical protein
MGVPTLEVGYNSATTGRGDHEVHKGHVVALRKKSSKDIKQTNMTIKEIRTTYFIFISAHGRGRLSPYEMSITATA